jgi:carboxymethylenebutenolidase
MHHRLALLAVLAAGCSATAPPTPPAPAAPTEEMVAYRPGVPDARVTLCRPGGDGPYPAVVLVHGDLGLTDYEKQRARRLAEVGFVALAVDLYHGQKVETVLDAHIMDRAMPEEQVQGELKAAVDYLVSRPDVRGDAVGIIGWDSGGGYALDAALRDARLRALVICYGRVLTEPASVAPLRAAVLGIFAGQDEGITPDTLRQFEAAMKKAGTRLAGVEVYPGCKHGFMSPITPDAEASPFAPEASADAWKKIEALLAAELTR